MSVSDTSSDFERLLSRFMRSCSRRDYCTSDIKRRLSAAGDSVHAERLISALKKDGFVDDARYARSYCRDKALLSGWGAAKIRYNLVSKGIAGDVIEEALSEVDARAVCGQLDAMVSRKWKEIRRRHPELPRSGCVARLLRFACGRGYSYGEVMESMERNGL